MPLEKLVAFTKKVQDLPDKPNATMTAAEVKAQFDAAPDEVRVFLNKLITALQSSTDGDSGADNIGATEIPGLEGNTVQTILESLKSLDDTNRAYLLSQIQNTVLGQIPDGTITDEKLSDSPTGIKTRFNEHSAERATLDEVGHVQLSNAINSTSNTLAATPSAVKSAMDRADAAFQSASDGKTAIASAVTDKGVPASPTDTFPTLASKIGQISTGKKWASGTLTPTNNRVTITGLDFLPFTIVISQSRWNDSNRVYQTIYSRNTFAGAGTQAVIYRENSPNTVNIDGVTNIVENGRFSLPVDSSVGTFEHKWIAYE